MVYYSSDELIPSSVFAKKFGSFLSSLKEKARFAIVKNNRVEAVIVSKDEYENMVNRLKTLEKEKFISSLNAGLEDVKNGKTKPIENLWNELDD